VHRLIGRVEIDALTPMRRWLMGTIPCRWAQAPGSGSSDGVLAMLNYFYRIAFEAGVTSSNCIIGTCQVVWEGIIHGWHIGEFAAIPTTGKEVRVPLCVVNDLANDQIVEMCIYFKRLDVLVNKDGVSVGVDCRKTAGPGRAIICLAD
jgi:hypothetical protein